MQLAERSAEFHLVDMQACSKTEACESLACREFAAHPVVVTEGCVEVLAYEEIGTQYYVLEEQMPEIVLATVGIIEIGCLPSIQVDKGCRQEDGGVGQTFGES